MSTMVERVAQALRQEMATAPFDEPASSFALARAASQRCGSQQRKWLMLGSGHRAP